jgi:hypothetical protein
MPVSLLALAGFLVLLSLAAIFLQRLLQRQVEELEASLVRTDQTLSSADALRADVARARDHRTRLADTVADAVADNVRGPADR